jgi:hypothetical protein
LRDASRLPDTHELESGAEVAPKVITQRKSVLPARSAAVKALSGPEQAF